MAEMSEVTFPNWLELPIDVMANILHRISVVDILENAQKVCTTWCKICKDPAMWRVLHMDYLKSFPRLQSEDNIFKNAVDRSQGELVDITIVNFKNEKLLHYVAADRSRQLRRLEIVFSYHPRRYGSLEEALMKFQILEELNLYRIIISKDEIETLSRCCPMLRALKVNRESCGYDLCDTHEVAKSCEYQLCDTEVAIAIGENLCELKHLELIGSSMLDTGLHAILDGCLHLESLDLRQCLFIDLNGDLKKKCLKRIKCLKLPEDSLDGCLYDIMKTYNDDEYSDYEDQIHDFYDEIAYQNLINQMEK